MDRPVLASLRDKYIRIRTLRTTQHADAVREMKALAREYPGALRELDELPLEAIDARIAALDRELDARLAADSGRSSLDGDGPSPVQERERADSAPSTLEDEGQSPVHEREAADSAPSTLEGRSPAEERADWGRSSLEGERQSSVQEREAAESGPSSLEGDGQSSVQGREAADSAPSALEGRSPVQERSQDPEVSTRPGDAGSTRDSRRDAAKAHAIDASEARVARSARASTTSSRSRTSEAEVSDRSPTPEAAFARGASEPWIVASAEFHAWMRAGLEVKRRFGRTRDANSARRWLGEHYRETPYGPTREVLIASVDAVLRPPGGRLTRWVFARLAAMRGTNPDELEALVFPPSPTRLARSSGDRRPP